MICPHCHDEKYEVLKNRIEEKIEMLQLLNQPYALRLLESLLEDNKK